jgi:hypothetical protein
LPGRDLAPTASPPSVSRDVLRSRHGVCKG